MDEDIFITNCNYRNFSFSIWKNDVGYYTILLGKIINFKSENWEAEIKETIDKQLDLIYSFTKNIWLSWFQNGNYRDIKLVAENRILRIFLVQKSDLSDHEFKEILNKKIIPESEKIIKKLYKNNINKY